MSDYILEMRNITKSFGGVKALKSVSINLLPNEILAIVGENGAGKSTLMKILSGSYPCTTYEGEIIVGGVPQRFYSPSDTEKSGIEMIYQELSMHLDMSVAENIFLGRLPSGVGIVRWGDIYERAREYTEMVGLDISVKHTLRSLSASQQQMVAIARALSRSPRILVLDEPTSALTEREVKILFDKLFELKEKGISSIFITHKMKEVMLLADRVTVLRDGEFVSTSLKAETTIQKTVEEMVNRKIANMYPKRQVSFGEEAFRVEGLTVPHPNTTEKNIVESISFSVRAGEILGIVGLVGSGRSETVNAIFGAIKKKSGATYMENREVRITHPRKAIRYGLALLTEDRKRNGTIADMDIAGNTTLASLKQISSGILLRRSQERQKALDYTEKLDIRMQSERDNIQSLSGGNQQKVVVSKWLMTHPKVMFLDEPTRGIDVGAKAQIYGLMCDLAEQGMAIVMISSELPEVVGMCDRFIVLADSKIKAEYFRGEVDEEKLLSSAVSS